MKWNHITDIKQLDVINQESTTQKILLFKHSTRCSISDAALGRMERKWKDENSEILKPYYLDLIAHRDISNQIAENYNVMHESPQALIISNGKCIFSQTHMNINLDEILEITK
ncbi:MAG: bacillithiol system redox-active protein YtxJ [Bacteroidota bacterium]|nr:bacillithiol system redox-active protein YtxJ [Bacteroidota bacterium]MDP3144720.1 bacillithiol system redox-active protein YtxJ [Bacteroidota bacterium]MDP3557903.1 bacillithiol system redox-active protein YtxJ [Bacteroidota bacterium]